MKLSIIIPAYNAEKYVERCVKSIISQNYIDSEILIIDDGSTDNTLDISNSLSCKYADIRVLHKKNGGVSSARNLGIDNARGEYIMFVDVDDYLLPDTLPKAVRVVEENPDADFCVFGFERSSRAGHQTTSILSPCIYHKSKRLEYIYKVDTVTFGSTWAKLYKRDFINSNSLRFDPDIIASEDNCFNFKVMEVTNCFVTSDIIVYYYDVNYQSATAKFIGDKYIENAKVYLNIINNCITQIKKENGNCSGNNYYAEQIIEASLKTICFNTLYQIYNVYRHKQIKILKKYRWMRRLMDFMKEIRPDWQKALNSGFPRVFSTAYRIHPRCADILLRIVFTVKH